MSDSKRRTELLAPAGNMDCLNAAITAGADAVYLAGKSYGARASADNFTDEELIQALNKAHLYNRKIYLTLNTLIKEREWKDIYGFLKPLYEEGLDGIIVQDIGLIDCLNEWFPLLPVHASTQLNVTDINGALWLKSKGVRRFITARELSLEEITYIKDEADIEIEVFVHGAMCYSYSGRCLFSSFLGGRSGNRGRCAGPCRLPYNDGEYILSMRDMCLIEELPALMDAGVDSFKIEGRLKSPEYVTGVVRLYREYMDAYSDGENKALLKEDERLLNSLYMRGGHSTGYLYEHNSKDMICVRDPSYKAPDKGTEKALREWDRGRDIRQPVDMYASFHVKQPACIRLTYDSDVSIEVYGDITEEAKGSPADKQDVLDRLCKTGQTPYRIDNCVIDMDDNCYLPVKSINELRRSATDVLNEARLALLRRSPDKTVCTDSIHSAAYDTYPDKPVCVDVSLSDISLLSVLKGMKADRVYIPYSAVSDEDMDALLLLGEFRKDCPATEIILRLPQIMRKGRGKRIRACVEHMLEERLIDGIMAENMDELYMISSALKAEEGKYSADIRLIADHSIYVWNRRSLKAVLEMADEATLPLELNLHELKEITSDVEPCRLSMTVYGRAPLMVSANCIKKTTGIPCDRNPKEGFMYIKDRQGRREPVYIACSDCLNVIYNALPTSCHKSMPDIEKCGIGRIRIELTDEPVDTAEALIDYYTGRAYETDMPLPVREYTSGHLQKGAI